MKVYIVYGCLDRENECDRHIYGVFDNAEKATDYAIKIGRKAFDECEVEPGNRECVILDEWNKQNYSKYTIAWLLDIEDYFVEIYVVEMEVK